MRGEKPPPGTFLNRGLAFQCPAWARSNMKHVLLTQVCAVCLMVVVVVVGCALDSGEWVEASRLTGGYYFTPSPLP